MASCASCGYPLGLGRFCSNCGEPVDPPADGAPRLANPVLGSAGSLADHPLSRLGDWRTDTAERPRVTAPLGPSTAAPPAVSTDRPATTPPVATESPPPPRFPLWADELYAASAPTATTPTAAPPAPTTAPPAPTRVDVSPTTGPAAYPCVELEPGTELEPGRRLLPWLAAAMVLVVLVGAGYWALTRGGGGGDSGGASDRPRHSRSPTRPARPPRTPVDVAGAASAQAPVTALADFDVDGEPVAYDASNMLDGVAETTWRTAGDATGMRLTFRLAAPTRLVRVGLINGFAKQSTDDHGRIYDWYLGNRRVLAVTWLLGRDTKVQQQLSEERGIQTVAVGPVLTRTVVLRIREVSPPGQGRASRDFTAISEVALLGLPRRG